MKTVKFLIGVAFYFLLATSLTSCFQEEDFGPIQEQEKEYAILDFDRLEMGDAFVIDVQQSTFFSVRAKGDWRNIDDLVVDKVGATLRVRFRSYKERQHTTYIAITMPSLKGVNFSGASVSTVGEFQEVGQLDYTLSGASISQLSVQTLNLDVHLSGASNLKVSGLADELAATVTGASTLSGFGLETEMADVDVSGASKATVTTSQILKATASGASVILYRGNPVITPTTSGASVIQPD